MPIFHPERAGSVLSGSPHIVESPVPYLERLLEHEPGDPPAAPEQPVSLYVNAREAVTFLCTPSGLVELTVGWLFAEGLIESASEVQSVGAACPELYRLYAYTVPDRWDERRGLRALLTSGCGAGGPWREELGQAYSKVTADLTVSLEQLDRLLRQMLQEAALYKQVGGVHSAALATAETVVLHYEDVGRHNAVDKCVGRALTEGLDCSRLILLSTGRVSSDLAHKAARAGIPIVASLNSATTLALDVARQAGLTVVGRAGAHKPHIHTGPQRLRPQ